MKQSFHLKSIPGGPAPVLVAPAPQGPNIGSKNVLNIWLKDFWPRLPLRLRNKRPHMGTWRSV